MRKQVSTLPVSDKLPKLFHKRRGFDSLTLRAKPFANAIAPFTATTSGIGRLIEAKFDRLVEAEKVLAAENVAKTAAKVARSRRLPSGKAKARIVVAAIEASGRETDPVMRELWSNLLAQEEITDGTVHPSSLWSFLG